MKKMSLELPQSSMTSTARHSRGFTLVELMVAMAVFLIIAGAALTLFGNHAALFADQQNQVGLNIGMRNTLSQIQIDAVNAGSGFYTGANVPNFPIGLTVVNSSGAGSCYNAGTNTYSATCFDKLNIIVVDPNTTPAHPDDGTNGCALTTNNTVFLTPQAGTTPAQLAAAFKAGDQIMFLKGDASQLTTAKLTAGGVVVGTRVQLQHGTTAADGTTSSGNDPLDIATHANPKLGSSFCPADWVLKLVAVTYSVDASNPAGPQLVRTQDGTAAVVADQIVGFKVGVSIFSGGASSDVYNYNAATYPTPYDFTAIRSLRVSLIGRTTPDPTRNYRNAFDNGPYKIQSVSIAIDPRNLSMRD